MRESLPAVQKLSVHFCSFGSGKYVKVFLGFFLVFFVRKLWGFYSSDLFLKNKEV